MYRGVGDYGSISIPSELEKSICMVLILQGAQLVFVIHTETAWKGVICILPVGTVDHKRIGYGGMNACNGGFYTGNNKIAHLMHHGIQFPVIPVMRRFSGLSRKHPLPSNRSEARSPPENFLPHRKFHESHPPEAHFTKTEAR
jgi:hypothetical protein